MYKMTIVFTAILIFLTMYGAVLNYTLEYFYAKERANYSTTYVRNSSTSSESDYDSSENVIYSKILLETRIPKDMESIDKEAFRTDRIIRESEDTKK